MLSHFVKFSQGLYCILAKTNKYISTHENVQESMGNLAAIKKKPNFFYYELHNSSYQYYTSHVSVLQLMYK